VGNLNNKTKRSRKKKRNTSGGEWEKNAVQSHLEKKCIGIDKSQRGLDDNSGKGWKASKLKKKN